MKEVGLTSKVRGIGKGAVKSLFNFWGVYGCSKERELSNGGVAQLGEHLLCKQGVIGSSPFISTIWAHSSDG